MKPAAIEIDFINPGGNFPGTPSTRAEGMQDFDLAKPRRLGVFLWIGLISGSARFAGQIPGGIDIPAAEIDAGATRRMLPEDDRCVTVIVHAAVSTIGSSLMALCR